MGSGLARSAGPLPDAEIRQGPPSTYRPADGTEPVEPDSR
jgi:hypothetical protein